MSSSLLSNYRDSMQASHSRHTLSRLQLSLIFLAGSPSSSLPSSWLGASNLNKCKDGTRERAIKAWIRKSLRCSVGWQRRWIYRHRRRLMRVILLWLWATCLLASWQMMSAPYASRRSKKMERFWLCQVRANTNSMRTASCCGSRLRRSVHSAVVRSDHYYNPTEYS